MKKRILILIALMAVLLLVAGPVHATPPIPASGTLDYTFEVLDMREADGNLFVYAIETEDWVGAFQGTGEAVFRVEMFSSGFWNVWLRSTFTGTVQGKSGTLVIQLVGKKPGAEDWYGRWVIISGTGDLANLRGQGTWGGPGFGAPGADIWYSGKIHFKPD